MTRNPSSTIRGPLEDTVERYLCAQVKARGGRAVKLNPSGAKGIPDRLVILPGLLAFVETKRPKGGVLDTLQIWWNKYLTRMGHPAHVLRTKEDVDDLLDHYDETAAR